MSSWSQPGQPNKCSGTAQALQGNTCNGARSKVSKAHLALMTPTPASIPNSEGASPTDIFGIQEGYRQCQGIALKDFIQAITFVPEVPNIEIFEINTLALRRMLHLLIVVGMNSNSLNST